MPVREIFCKQTVILVGFLPSFLKVVLFSSFLSGFVSFDTFRLSSLISCKVLKQVIEDPHFKRARAEENLVVNN